MVRQDHKKVLRRKGKRTGLWIVVPATVGMAAAVLTPVAAGRASASGAPPTCQASSPGGPVFITSECVDPVLNQPYIDAEYPGTATDPTTNVTVSYTYVHGGFAGTNAKFAFYFPTADQYKGRFFEGTYPTLGRENASPDCLTLGETSTTDCSVVFAISNGAYVVSSNNAGGVPAGGALAPYRANAAAAEYSRVVARQLYGDNISAPRGYLYGASGGAYQTVGAMENTSGVWQGAVPMVFGAPNAIPSFQTNQILGLDLLGPVLPQIADAMAPGGSGNPYAGLTPEQQSILKEVTTLGFPLRGWWQYLYLQGGAFLAVQGVVRALDPSYVTDFWTKPGYEGTQAAVQATRIENYGTTVTGLSGTNGLVLASVPAGELNNADLQVTSGPLAGRALSILSVIGDTVELAGNNPGITAGTTVQLDNSWLIALQYYQRHQVPNDREYAWNQYLGPDGQPLEPQRQLLTGPILTASTAGSVPNGNFHGKMIMLGSTMDVQAYPWSEDWYRSKAQAALGSAFDNSYRLWYQDNADHNGIGPSASPDPTAADHIVGDTGELQQALLDLDAWVADNIQPPASTNYGIDATDGVQLPARASQRDGVQPVVTLTARAGAGTPPSQRIDVAAGHPVTLSMDAQAPPGTGAIVNVQWDFEGTGTFDVTSPLSHIGPEVNLQETYTFTQPGTYFPVVRVTSQRNGDTTTPFGLIQNLAAVRIVVH